MGKLLYVISILSAVWVLYEVWSQNPRLGTGSKILWTLAAIFFSIITAIIYAATEKSRY